MTTTGISDKQSMRGAVVVVGSLHYDILVESSHTPIKGETVTGTRWYPKFGGKGGNQAVAAKLHGANTRMVSATGTDNFADYLHERLAHAGISSDFVDRLDSVATGMSVAIQDSDGDYGAVIVSGSNLAISPAVLDKTVLWEGAAVLLLQNEVLESLNVAAAMKARDLGCKVCLNAAPAREMSADFLTLVDILIVNAIEANDLCGVNVDSLQSAAVAARKLSARFSTVIVTAGGAGVAACTSAGEDFVLPAKPIEVVSTHGAGDMFCGVLCAELANGASVESAITVANESAADHVAKQ